MFFKKKFERNNGLLILMKKVYLVKCWILLINYINYFSKLEKKFYFIKSEKIYKNSFLKAVNKIQSYLKTNFIYKIREKKKKSKFIIIKKYFKKYFNNKITN